MRVREPLRRALQRASAPGTVMVSEYPLDPRPRYGWGRPAHPALTDVLAADIEAHVDVLRRCASHRAWFETIPRVGDGTSLSWDNEWWGGLDAAVQCTLLIERNPTTYLEVGSGFSTMFARRAIDDHGLRTRIVSVDPHPRVAIDRLCDEVVRAPFEDIELGRIAELEAGDVVLVDNSHMALMNSDATAFFLDALPVMPAGVIVGIDDVFLPWDYHPTWAGRWYGEQYLLAAWLLGGHAGWEIRFPGWLVTDQCASHPDLEPLWPILETAGGKVALSFWMERTARPPRTVRP